jgi:hypothetical protein
MMVVVVVRRNHPARLTWVVRERLEPTPDHAGG